MKNNQYTIDEIRKALTSVYGQEVLVETKLPLVMLPSFKTSQIGNKLTISFVLPTKYKDKTNKRIYITKDFHLDNEFSDGSLIRHNLSFVPMQENDFVKAAIVSNISVGNMILDIKDIEEIMLKNRAFKEAIRRVDENRAEQDSQPE